MNEQTRRYQAPDGPTDGRGEWIAYKRPSWLRRNWRGIAIALACASVIILTGIICGYVVFKPVQHTERFQAKPKGESQ